MARSAKHTSSSSTGTKVKSVTSIKMALSVLALGFASLAAAAAATSSPKQPDLVIRNVQLNYTGYYYNELPVVNATLVVSNIGTAPTPTSRPFRITLQSDSIKRFVCGFGYYGCQSGKLLPETSTGGKYYIDIPAGVSIPVGGSRKVEFMVGGITNEAALNKFALTTQITAAIETAGYFPELNNGNNAFSYKFLTNLLLVKKFVANDFIAGLCGGYGYGYGSDYDGGYGYGSGVSSGYGYNNADCYPASSSSYSECGYGYGYNNAQGCVKL